MAALSRSLTQRRDFPEFFKSSCYTLPSTWEGSTIRKKELTVPGDVTLEKTSFLILSATYILELRILSSDLFLS
ncbi:hypothetical protein TNCV_269041 [Trichonephila clavipes]|nr:hypothetical protein TNCV_269041 [Trichonephila clavipes]